MKNVVISVGEPWDFEGPDGENVIYGSLEKIIDSKFVIVTANKALKLGELTGNKIILTPRYEKGVFTEQSISDGIAVNGALIDSDTIELPLVAILGSTYKFLLAGSVKLAV